MAEPYLLYGAEISYYSAKIRAYLRYKGIPYREIVASAWQYKRVIEPRTGVRFIPIVITPDDQALQDTTAIIDALEQRFPQRSVYPDTPKQRLTALLLEMWADEWLVLPAMHYRWNFSSSREYIYGRFGATALPFLPAVAQKIIGRKFGQHFRSMVPNIGITDETQQAIEQWTVELLAQLEQHFSQHDFLLGDRPCIGDFGLIGPFYAHLYLDPHPGKLLRKQAPCTCAWIERMMARQSTVSSSADFLPEDQVPDTLAPILQRLFAEHIPVLQDTAKHLSPWVRQHPERKYIKRIIGKHGFKLGTAIGTRVMLPYSLWMYQRPLDYYQSLSDDQQQTIRPWLVEHGGLKAVQFELPQRVERVNNRLVAV